MSLTTIGRRPVPPAEQAVLPARAQLRARPTGFPGTAASTRTATTRTSTSPPASCTGTPATAFQATTSFGLQLEQRESRRRLRRITGRTRLPGKRSPADPSLNLTADGTSWCATAASTAGGGAPARPAAVLCWARFRAEQSSNAGDPDKHPLLPQGPGLLLDARHARRRRAAAGAAGLRRVRQPAALRLEVLVRHHRLDRRHLGKFPGDRAGNALIEPERQAEFELGFDAQFARGRAELNATVYQKHHQQPPPGAALPPTRGLESRSSPRTARCGTGASRRCSRSRRFGARTFDVADPDHLLSRTRAS